MSGSEDNTSSGTASISTHVQHIWLRLHPLLIFALEWHQPLEALPKSTVFPFNVNNSQTQIEHHHCKGISPLDLCSNLSMDTAFTSLPTLGAQGFLILFLPIFSFICGVCVYVCFCLVLLILLLCALQ